jgi:hypothetical protein
MESTLCLADEGGLQEDASEAVYHVSYHTVCSAVSLEPPADGSIMPSVISAVFFLFALMIFDQTCI